MKRGTVMVAARRESMPRQLAWASAILGFGLMAAIDEIVFHQVLSWHHFYDGSTPDIALLSDGFLHAGELVAIVAGFFLFMDVRSHGPVDPLVAWGWGLVGAGAFQLFDGVVDHKLLRLHQVRYGVDTLPYDLAWNAAGLLMIVVGLLLVRRARASSPATARPIDG